MTWTMELSKLEDRLGIDGPTPRLSSQREAIRGRRSFRSALGATRQALARGSVGVARPSCHRRKRNDVVLPVSSPRSDKRDEARIYHDGFVCTSVVPIPHMGSRISSPGSLYASTAWRDGTC
jgi:hypothetical protein